MDLMMVILNDCWQSVYDRLDKDINYFNKEGITIDKDIYKQGKITYIQYAVKESSLKNYTTDDFGSVFKYYMANIFSEIILKDMEEKLANKILANQYYYFNLQERKSILKHLKTIQDQEVYKYREDEVCIENRKEKIIQEIISYLRENNIINLKGFVRFRLRSYIEELENNIDKAVEDYLMEKEYNEFIRLLRYFVDIQEAKIDMVNVLIRKDGKYDLYDYQNKSINNEYLEDLALEMADKDISYDDLLISSLITLAPRKIVIHFSSKIKKKEIIETIKNVFSDRVYMCSGCELCLSSQNIIQE
ncbi:putative sporulation protein YtxC [Crassaminicella thermophila]|uniref:Putative sporulation protein YtxC n=1 Tax=Crassaminicella thermophila TaxID=2599308 RepID=A0A5C0SFE8_CRATE|nr:putative sporulation protein YtxC [Crassaminicella thermophila]QEK12506.1 putative sporulation protein YtxC [Crassaminicella thermophila]